MSHDHSPEPQYRDAVLGFHAADGAWREVPIQLRPRGKSRRDGNLCAFPPLSVKLPTAELTGTVFENQTRLKLTTHCRPSANHARYVYKEYLAYRMLNLVSEVSFRAQAVQVTYTDSGGRASSTPELFELLIGNTDFSFVALPTNKPCCHNSVAYEGPSSTYLPLPYDFDMSGFVNPPYALPDSRLPITNVRQRLYRGYCRSGAVHERAGARMQDVRPALFELLRRETPLDARTRKEAMAFITGFYAILDDPKRLERMVFNACTRGSAPPAPT